MKEARRIEPIKSAIFAEMNAVKAEVEAKGVSIINLGIGSPDQPPAAHVIERLKKELDVRQNYDYATSEGLSELREAVSIWYKRRFNVELNPHNEVLTLMGSHDGLAHICLALLNPGDVALIPDPHYPVYKVGALLAEAKIHPVPLLAKNNFLPDFERIPQDIANQARIIILNYPNNPVTATADYSFYERAVEFARAHDVLLCHDAAYSELAFEGFKPPSALQVPGAKEMAVEFHSVSKTYNIAGCRLGFVVGNPEVVGILARLKTNLDYGVFKAVQYAGVAALLGPQDIIQKNVENYQRRMKVFVEGVGRLGWEIEKSKATMFLWAPVPGKTNSRDFAIRLLEEAGVLVKPVEVLQEAVERISRTNLMV